jgi:phage baseplate assembly protein W
MRGIDYTGRLNTAILQDKIVFYKDLNNKYLDQSQLTPLILTDLEAIEAQMINVLVTPIGTEPFMPTYGSMLYYRISEPINVETAYLLEIDTIEALKMWMSDRITVYMGGTYITPYTEEDAYDIQVAYSVNNGLSGKQLNYRIYR